MTTKFVINSYNLFLSLTGKNLPDKLFEGLKTYGVDLLYLRGQAYDGAASMTGKCHCVHYNISAVYLQALYIDCALHNLNLVLGNAVSVTEIRNCISITEMTYIFFQYS